MTGDNHNPVWKWLGIALVLILGIFIIVKVVFPVIGWLSLVLWSIAGFFSFVFQIFAFIFLFVAAIIGFLMLIAWIIRQFME